MQECWQNDTIRCAEAIRHDLNRRRPTIENVMLYYDSVG